MPTNNEGARRNNCMGRTLTGNAIDMRGIDLGTVVKVKGGISEFWDVKQITLERFGMLSSIYTNFLMTTTFVVLIREAQLRYSLIQSLTLSDRAHPKHIRRSCRLARNARLPG